MKAIVHFFKHIRIVYKRSSALLKCVVLTALVVSAVALLTLRGAYLQQLQQQGLEIGKASLQELFVAMVS